MWQVRLRSAILVNFTLLYTLQTSEKLTVMYRGNMTTASSNTLANKNKLKLKTKCKINFRKPSIRAAVLHVCTADYVTVCKTIAMNRRQVSRQHRMQLQAVAAPGGQDRKITTGQPRQRSFSVCDGRSRQINHSRDYHQKHRYQQHPQMHSTL